MEIFDGKGLNLFGLSGDRGSSWFAMKEVLYVIEKADIPSDLIDYVYHPEYYLKHNDKSKLRNRIINTAAIGSDTPSYTNGL